MRALLRGIPVIYDAPHWIMADAAGADVNTIEAPHMPVRRFAFQRLAWAQWAMKEIESGAAYRHLLSLP